MRPIRRGLSPTTSDFAKYQDAKPELVARLGPYCSFCERSLPAGLAVEHIQAKDLNEYRHLERTWSNFLLACVNCNSTKSTTNVTPGQYVLPDRDNTFAVFLYAADGSITVHDSMEPGIRALAERTLKLVGLGKAAHLWKDANGRAVALDRMSQRMQAWSQAEVARADIESNPRNEALKRQVLELAKSTGFFSVWMSVFSGHPGMRRRLIEAFPGTNESGCFDSRGDPVTPAPNPDGLESGGKT
ncbi:MAG: HNH endonuclease [Bryobacteraceae bacterium]